jgi:hypothetical protein
VAAFWTVFLLLYATFLYWYVVHEPVMSHPGSFFLAAAVLRLWWGERRALGTARAGWLGLLIGLAACVRWQNGVLLLLPAASLLPRLRREPIAAVRAGLLTLAAFGLGALPQLLAWKAIFGAYLLADPPHGRDFLRLDHPYLLQTFFSSRHGLLYWTPVLWGGFLGLIPLLRRERATGIALLVPLALMAYVNVCSGDWWAGGSFSNRRFDSLLPLLALGLGLTLAWIRDLVARRPGAPILLGAFALTLWNALLMKQYREVKIPLDETLSFARVAENSAAAVADAVGTPLAWPANWVFAAEHDLPPASYDLMVGKYLFYRQNNLGGVIDLGDPRMDPALLDPGWTSVKPCEGASCRGVMGTARLMAPLDVPEPLTIVLRARGQGTLGLAVNGVSVAAFALEAALSEHRVRIPAERFRRELNELRFSVEPGGQAQLDRVAFERERR